MEDCKYLKTEDVTPWNGDVYDHPDYEYICQESKKKIFPPLHCSIERCKNYAGDNISMKEFCLGKTLQDIDILFGIDFDNLSKQIYYEGVFYQLLTDKIDNEKDTVLDVYVIRDKRKR